MTSLYKATATQCLSVTKDLLPWPQYQQHGVQRAPMPCTDPAKQAAPST